jgi:anthranilate phosphoribosyltransferase
MNAAAGLLVGAKVESLAAGVEMAREAIEKGEVYDAFHVYFSK